MRGYVLLCSWHKKVGRAKRVLALRIQRVQGISEQLSDVLHVLWDPNRQYREDPQVPRAVGREKWAMGWSLWTMAREKYVLA